MAEQFTPVSPLAAVSPLGGHTSGHDGTTLAEVTGLSLVSLAVSAGSEKLVGRSPSAIIGKSSRGSVERLKRARPA